MTVWWPLTMSYRHRGSRVALIGAVLGAAVVLGPNAAVGTDSGTTDESREFGFDRDGDAYVVTDWDIFQAISANDVLSFARCRHGDVKARLEGLEEGSFGLEDASKQVRGDKAFRAELASIRAAMRTAVFEAQAGDVFGVQHLGKGHFFLFIAGGAADDMGDFLVQGRFPDHDGFSMANFHRFRKILDRDGPMWGIDLQGMPDEMRHEIEAHFHDWKLRWRWKGLARPRRSWTLELGETGRAFKRSMVVYTMDELSLQFLDSSGSLLWTAK